MRICALTFCVVLLGLGCDDATPSNTSTVDTDALTVMGTPTGDGAMMNPDEGMTPADMGSMAMAEPAYVEASLSPRRSIYTLSD